MENESKSNYRCYMCTHFQRFFIKGEKHFKQIKLGRCCKSGETVNIHNTCEQFKWRIKRRRINGSVRISLEYLLTELSSIRKIIEEDIDAEENF